MIDKNQYGPWAVIAGGSEGVGAAFADELSRAGLNLVLIARKPGPLEETAEKVRANGVEVRTLSLDLLADDALDRIRKVTDDVEVGLLIFNAGANSYGHEFVTGDLAGFNGVINLNITKQLELSHHFGGKMKDRGRGGIMLLGSLAGYMGSEHQSIYASSKAFSRVFAESLWLELAPHNVHVVELILGVTRTPAMVRAGLNFDIPGMIVQEPEDAAREGLEHLTDGPVWVAGGNYEAAQKRSGFPRDKMVKGAAEAMRKLLNRG
ncbi:SDR family NAD(P)-dependent oxidoreductase [Rhodococcus sp. SGAir0479]|uniref:SDR family NAD(P)-dependent oxidoreductase n=1 Tax=Rhodococcus sp. SGAir0479 TaxID=2567884 RepID=UPI0010CD67E1|nr:SDR family NAD(P)-dependent oxidoreductase [Rhodococcus sp. SGAir0479]QCQ92795.1 SDR family NAD(P)-dependent oxidoreductase [Rhodococcus sp. SGAir0479]